MIIMHLEELLEAKGETIYSLAKKTGIGFQRLHKQNHNRATMIRLDTIDKICEALDCTVGELMEYLPNKKRSKKR